MLISANEVKQTVVLAPMLLEVEAQVKEGLGQRTAIVQKQRDQ